MIFNDFKLMLPLKGYINNSDYQKAKTPFITGWNEPGYNGLSQDEFNQHIRIGGWIGYKIPLGYIVVDIDDISDGENIVHVLDSQNLNFGLIKTPHGMQIIFKDSKDVKQGAKLVNALGVCTDFRTNEKGYIVIPTDNISDRLWIKKVENPDILPYYLKPITISKEFQGGIILSEGSRNETMYSHYKRLMHNGYSPEQAEEVLSLMNEYLSDKPLPLQELKRTIKSSLNAFNKSDKKIYNQSDNTNIPRTIDLSEKDYDNIPESDYIDTGFKALDRILKPKCGELIVWTGENESGKSTIISQVILNSIEAKEKVFVYSGELSTRSFQEWLHKQAAGVENLECFINRYGDTEWIVKKEYNALIRDWYRGKLFLHDREVSSNAIIDAMEEAYEKGCRLFIIDNLMSSRCDDPDIKEKDYLRRQSNFTNQLVTFANLHNVIVHLIAHPKKLNGRKKPTKDDISGSGDITNFAHSVITIRRLDETEAREKKCDTILQLVKSRTGSPHREIPLKFVPNEKRFYDLDRSFTYRPKTYSWKKQVEEPIEEQVEEVDIIAEIMSSEKEGV